MASPVTVMDTSSDRSLPADIENLRPGWGALERDGGPSPPPRRGIDPRLWGPSAWTFLHYVALGYPINPTPRDVDDYRSFISSLPYIIPCQKCRLNLAAHLNTMPPDAALASGRAAFFAWTVDLHNVSLSEWKRPCFTHDMAVRRYAQNRVLVLTAARRRSELFVAVVAGALIASLVMMWSTRSQNR